MIEKGDVQSAVDALRLEAIGWVHMCGQSGNLLHVPCLTTHIAEHKRITSLSRVSRLVHIH